MVSFFFGAFPRTPKKYETTVDAVSGSQRRNAPQSLAQPPHPVQKTWFTGKHPLTYRCTWKISWKLSSKTHGNNGQYFWDTWAFQIDFLIIKIANRFLSRLHGYILHPKEPWNRSLNHKSIFSPSKKMGIFLSQKHSRSCQVPGSRMCHLWILGPRTTTKPSGAWEAARSNKRRFTPPTRSRSV